MQRLRAIWEAFKTVAILFSLVVNVVLVIALISSVSLIVQIKNEIAEPLVDGLQTNFIGLDQATIDRMIPVREVIPVQFDLPLRQNTTVVLTSPVPLAANAQFSLPGGGGMINGTVSLQLPQGMQLPIALDFAVPVDTTLPVNLDVRALIPIQETQLHDPLQNLRALLEPYVNAMENLPDSAAGGWALLTRVLNGDAPDLFAPAPGGHNVWPGYAFPAGEGYESPADAPAQPGTLTTAPDTVTVIDPSADQGILPTPTSAP